MLAHGFGKQMATCIIVAEPTSTDDKDITAIGNIRPSIRWTNAPGTITHQVRISL